MIRQHKPRVVNKATPFWIENISNCSSPVTLANSSSYAFQYDRSFDGITWVNWGTLAASNGISITLSAGQRMYIRAKQDYTNVSFSPNTGHFRFNTSSIVTVGSKIQQGMFRVGGSIMSLFTNNYRTATTCNQSYLFYGLFEENPFLRDACELILPSTSPYVVGVFERMFRSCPKLITAPVLPKIDDPTNAWYSAGGHGNCLWMFQSCGSLAFLDCRNIGSVNSQYTFENMLYGCSPYGTILTSTSSQATKIQSGYVSMSAETRYDYGANWLYYYGSFVSQIHQYMFITNDSTRPNCSYFSTPSHSFGSISVDYQLIKTSLESRIQQIFGMQYYTSPYRGYSDAMLTASSNAYKFLIEELLNGSTSNMYAASSHGNNGFDTKWHNYIYFGKAGTAGSAFDAINGSISTLRSVISTSPLLGASVNAAAYTSAAAVASTANAGFSIFRSVKHTASDYTPAMRISNVLRSAGCNAPDGLNYFTDSMYIDRLDLYTGMRCYLPFEIMGAKCLWNVCGPASGVGHAGTAQAMMLAPVNPSGQCTLKWEIQIS